MAYLATARNLADIAEALYIFLPDFVTVCVHFHLKKYIHVVEKSIEKLESPSFLSQNEVEDKFVAWAIRRTQFLYRASIGFAFVCVIAWTVDALMAISDEKMPLIAPARFPFNTDSGVGFVVVWIFQNIVENFIVFIYMTYSTIITAVFLHGTAQLRRLGQHLMEVSKKIN